MVMPKNSVVLNPAAVLFQKTHPVPPEEIRGVRIQRIIKRMSAALRVSRDGIGIAAPQIGEPLRVFLASEEALRYDEAKEMNEEKRNSRVWEHYVFINPVITNYSRKKSNEVEGCLSVPGKFGTVARSEKVTITAYDEYGKQFTRGASKLFARLMQHEVDHLEGKLFLSKAKNLIDIKKEEKKVK